MAELELLSREGTQVNLMIDGQPFNVDLVLGDNGGCSIIHEGNSFNAGIVRGEGGRAYDVTILNRSYHVDIVDSQARYQGNRRTAGASQANRIVSPMPGRVVSIPVSEGDRLSAGDVAVVVEAMKMQNNYKVNADCTVGRILVAEGDTIESNQTLMELIL